MTESRDHWVLYEINMDGSRAFVRNNAGLHAAGADEERPYSLRVEATFLRPTPHGMPGPGEFDQLSPFEQAMIDRLAPNPLVGAVTCDGKRSWFFYTDDATRDGDVVLRLAKEHVPAYAVDHGSFHDPEWEQYFEFLYPNKLAWRYINDLELVHVLEGHGDPGDVPRDISHWAYFDTVGDRNRFQEEISALGYEIDDAHSEAEGERPHALQFRNTVAPLEIFPYTERLEMTADECNGQYDGWETMVLRADASPPERRGILARIKGLFKSDGGG